MACTKYTVLNLSSIILLSIIIFLDNNKRYSLYLLISSESLTTLITHSTTANRCIIIRWSRINYSSIIATTKWTSHAQFPLLLINTISCYAIASIYTRIIIKMDFKCKKKAHNLYCEPSISYNICYILFLISIH